MGGKNASVYYRKNGYKKRRLRHIIMIALILTVALFFTFVIVGNILNKKTNEGSDNKASNISSTLPPENLATPYSIKGYYIDINDPSSKLSELSRESVRDVSIKISDESGKLAYSSPTAQRFGYQSASNSLTDLGEVIRKIKSYGMSSSAVVSISGFSEKDAKTRAVILAYEAAIICEISEYGVSDITVRCTENDTQYIDEILNFANTVKNINSDIKIGFAVTNEFLSHPDSAVYIDKLARAYTFISIDLTDPKGMDISEYVDISLSDSNNRYYILRYNMRVLLPHTADEAIESSIQSSIEENSIQNWQKIS